MMAYLEERYGGQFEFVDWLSDDDYNSDFMGNWTHTVYVNGMSVRNNKNEYFYVKTNWREEKRPQTVTIWDDYITTKHFPTLTQELKLATRRVFGNPKNTLENPDMNKNFQMNEPWITESGELPVDMAYEEYVAWYGARDLSSIKIDAVALDNTLDNAKMLEMERLQLFAGELKTIGCYFSDVEILFWLEKSNVMSNRAL